MRCVSVTARPHPALHPSPCAVPDPAPPSPSSSSSPGVPFPPPRWVSVLQNSKDEALSNAFKGEPNGGGAAAGGGADGGVQELTKLVISEVKNMPGNKQCCDCGAPGRSGHGVSPRPGCGSGTQGGQLEHLMGLGGDAEPRAAFSLQIPRGSPPTWAS